MWRPSWSWPKRIPVRTCSPARVMCRCLGIAWDCLGVPWEFLRGVVSEGPRRVFLRGAWTHVDVVYEASYAIIRHERRLRERHRAPSRGCWTGTRARASDRTHAGDRNVIDAASTNAPCFAYVTGGCGAFWRALASSGLRGFGASVCRVDGWVACFSVSVDALACVRAWRVPRGRTSGGGNGGWEGVPRGRRRAVCASRAGALLSAGGGWGGDGGRATCGGMMRDGVRIRIWTSLDVRHSYGRKTAVLRSSVPRSATVG